MIRGPIHPQLDNCIQQKKFPSSQELEFIPLDSWAYVQPACNIMSKADIFDLTDDKAIAPKRSNRNEVNPAEVRNEYNIDSVQPSRQDRRGLLEYILDTPELNL